MIILPQNKCNENWKMISIVIKIIKIILYNITFKQ